MHHQAFLFPTWTLTFKTRFSLSLRAAVSLDQERVYIFREDLESLWSAFLKTLQVVRGAVWLFGSAIWGETRRGKFFTTSTTFSRWACSPSSSFLPMYPPGNEGTFQDPEIELLFQEGQLRAAPIDWNSIAPISFEPVLLRRGWRLISGIIFFLFGTKSVSSWFQITVDAWTWATYLDQPVNFCLFSALFRSMMSSPLPSPYHEEHTCPQMATFPTSVHHPSVPSKLDLVRW